MSEKKKTLTILLAVILLTGIFIIARISWTPPAESPASGYLGRYTPPLANAPQGKLVEGFPKDLILNDNPNITASYSITDAVTNQFTAQWNSSSSIDDIEARYKAFLQSKGWTVSVPNPPAPWMRTVTAATSTASLLVSIGKDGKESRIVATYIKK